MRSHKRSAALAASISFAALAAGLAAGLAAPAFAQDADSGFDLGRIIVVGQRPEGIRITSSTLSSEAMRTFNRNTLDDAANLMPGVNASNSGGSRNERLIYVRGFDRFQVPLSIDGIRVYLPADNRLDYGRFLTPDIAEVQVSKGYASVLDGPGAMGGAINLVTRTPTEALEAEARVTGNFDNDGDYAGQTVFALVGSRQESWYIQGSYAQSYVDHWDLSEDYVPTATSVERGGMRDFSKSRDERYNLKIGFTPNATDEYSLSYTYQDGSKNAPLHVTDGLATQRNWTWPYWTLDSLYFLSRTAIGDRATLKTRLYFNTFDNLLASYNNAAQNSQTLPRAFNSYYEDEAWGASAQLDYAVSDRDTFSIALHHRGDEHVEYQQVFPSRFIEPRQTNQENTSSIAAENRLQISPDLLFTAGVSYDWRDLRAAEEYGAPPGGGGNAIFSYPLVNADAWNGQARLDWSLQNGADIYASVSSRARFPTIFERFSSRFGGAVSNPGLKAERATNFELGGVQSFGAVRAEGALFYSDLEDAIFSFPFIFTTCTPAGVCTPNAVSQSRNVGSGEMYGVELNLSAALTDTLSAGANYTWTHRDITDPSIAAFQPTGVPEHKAFAYVDWSPLPGLTITPNVDIASDRWTVNTAGTVYYETGSYFLANLTAAFAINDRVEISAGARNIFDKNYVLTDGFPEAGRSLFLTLRARY